MTETWPNTWYAKQFLPASEESFRILHEVYRGAQDVYDKIGEKCHPYLVDPTKPRRIISDPVGWKNIIHMTHPLNRSDWVARGVDTFEGVTNIRLEGTPEALATVERAELNIGGMRYDMLYPGVMGCFSDDKGTLNFWHTNEGRVIPAIQHHEVDVIVRMPHDIAKDVRLVYDIVPLDGWKAQLGTKSVSCELPTIQHQYTGVEDSSSPLHQHLLNTLYRYTYKLNFNHPIMEIHMRTENPIKEARLMLNREYELPLTRGNDGLWSIVFSKAGDGAFVGDSSAGSRALSTTLGVGDLTTTLNASRIDTLAIQVEPEGETSPGLVWIWSKNFHMARIMGGMIGLAFSK